MQLFFKILISIQILVISNSFQDNFVKYVLQYQDDKNILISPFSIYQIFALMSNGANGETQDEILQTLLPLHYSEDNILKKINSNMKNIMNQLEININNQLNFTSNKITSTMQCINNCSTLFINSNAIFSNKFEFSGEFSSICNEYQFSIYEFERIEKLNNWIDKVTNGRIKKIYDENENIDNYVYEIINTLYFKGSWKYKFVETQQTFKNYNGLEIMVDSLYNKLLNVPYYEDETVQMISLPFVNSSIDYKMTIILPKDNIYYSSLYYYLDYENINFAKLLSKLKEVKQVEIYLPKFELEYSIELKDILTKMGIIKAFSEDGDFTKINKSYNTYIKNIFHSTFIKIDQNITESASSKIGTDIGSTQYIMNVNHSFIFLITSNSIKDLDGNNFILFSGTINNLQTSSYSDYSDYSDYSSNSSYSSYSDYDIRVDEGCENGANGVYSYKFINMIFNLMILILFL